MGDPSSIARVSHLSDALNGIVVDALISPKGQGERSLAVGHTQHLKSDDLVLMDRGYPAFWLFVLILSSQAHFCAFTRISTPRSLP